MKHRRQARGRKWLVAALATAAVLAIGGAGWAYFASTGSGSGAANVGALTSPTHVVAGTPTGSTVPVSWSGVTEPSGGSSGYYVTRTPSPSGPSTMACGSSPASLLTPSSNSCNDTSVPDGTYTYTVTVIYNSFSAVSTSSNQVTVASVAPTAAAPGVSAAVTHGTNPEWVNGETVTLTDSPSANGGPALASVSYYYCLVTSAPCTSSNWTPIGSATSGGTWSVTWSSGSLPGDQTYDVVATATNASPLTSPPSSATEIGVDTTPPSVSTPSVNGIS